jgi:hypothetical protein
MSRAERLAVDGELDAGTGRLMREHDATQTHATRKHAEAPISASVAGRARNTLDNHGVLHPRPKFVDKPTHDALAGHRVLWEVWKREWRTVEASMHVRKQGTAPSSRSPSACSSDRGR